MKGMKIKITLDRAEYLGLLELATREMRTPDQQMHYLLRRELFDADVLGKKFVIGEEIFLKSDQKK